MYCLYAWLLQGSPPLTRGKPSIRKKPTCSLRITPAHAGKTISAVIINGIFIGSPPLTRGKQSSSFIFDILPRITPAHAGKTGFMEEGIHKYRDHPRSRGENNKQIQEAWIEWGSPPLTRGKRCKRKNCDVTERITPAHAGKTNFRYPVTLRLGDHPRSRGENRKKGIEMGGVIGSPPLTRGKLNNAAYCVRGARITPAHAGKTES